MKQNRLKNIQSGLLGCLISKAKIKFISFGASAPLKEKTVSRVLLSQGGNRWQTKWNMNGKPGATKYQENPSCLRQYWLQNLVLK